MVGLKWTPPRPGPLRNHRKPRKGFMQRVVIRVGCIGYAGAALVWAVFITIIFLYWRFFLVLIQGQARVAAEDDSDYDELGRRVDSNGRRRLYPDT